MRLYFTTRDLEFPSIRKDDSRLLYDSMFVSDNVLLKTLHALIARLPNADTKIKPKLNKIRKENFECILILLHGLLLNK